MSEVRATDPVEVEAGFWLPRTCITTYYALPDGKQRATLLNLVEWQVNDLLDASFAIEVPPNAMVVDFSETARRGLSHRNPLVRYSSGDGELMDRPLKEIFAERRARWFWFFFTQVAVVAAVATSGWVAWRRSRRRSAKQA